MYKIGEFSKIVDIPVRTLRYYDEYGLLCPKKIDNFTGYRYYSEENIIECELIKLLKSVNFSLEEIVAYKDSLTEEIIEMKKEEVLRNIAELEKKYQRLENMQMNMKENNNNVKKLKKESDGNE